MDIENIVGTEDYEEVQKYFERRKSNYVDFYSNSIERLERERVLEINEEKEGDIISDRQRALAGILDRIQKISSNEQKPSVSEAKIKE